MNKLSSSLAGIKYWMIGLAGALFLFIWLTVDAWQPFNGTRTTKWKPTESKHEHK